MNGEHLAPGVGRCAAWTLACLDWPNGAASRAALMMLNPTQPGNLRRNFLRWQNRAEAAGLIQHGRVVLRPVRTDELFACAVDGLRTWTMADFVDLAGGLRRIEEWLATRDTEPLASRLAVEAGFLRSLAAGTRRR